MNLLPGVAVATSDGVIGSSGKPIRIFAIHLVSGAADSTAIVYNGTSASGTKYAQVDGVALEGVTLNFAGGMRFPSGCFIDVDANIDYCSIIFTEEF